MPEFRPAPARLPAGRRIYAVGDIHGCADRLAALHGLIAADHAARPGPSGLLLHLGDFVDKGGDSAGVLRWMTGAALPESLAVKNLTGNHEVAMLAALEGGPGDVADWLWCGGRATLASYGLSPEAAAADWAAAIPSAHHAFLRGLELFHQEGGYCFVHAGLRPGTPFPAQAREDLTRIRQPFLSWTGPHDFVVVHGHTARAEPEVLPNRINLDTAAWSGGPLTCAVLEEDRIGFLFA
ncbi:metallophosphoesterase [Roseomonas sp. KE0001]|uniref:metallophosphoesterase n=1 Tax=Roseomonas sp. KE0001 TaxID=2479201 RepID=UPI0018DF0C5D|nr:serine/threonine protein phosphatase [Roseomonas sp. KE0001]